MTTTPTKLLLVDDEEDFVSALAERLRMRNYKATIATSGEAAMLLMPGNRPDIVLLDLKMPGMGGMKTLKKIKTEYPSIDVIMVTGSVDSKVGESTVSAGATAHMVKPFDFQSLLDKIGEITRKRGPD